MLGKNAIELLNEANNAIEVARFIHPGLTPLARLDESGLLAPLIFSQSKLNRMVGRES